MDATPRSGWWRVARTIGAAAADLLQSPPPGVVGSTATALHQRRAQNFDDYSPGSVRLVDESKARGTAVGATADGPGLKFSDARLGSGVSEFGARVAGSSGTVEVRLGSPTGPLVGTARTGGTASPYDYTTVIPAALTGAAKGRTSVYLALEPGVRRLSTFTLRR